MYGSNRAASWDVQGFYKLLGLPTHRSSESGELTQVVLAHKLAKPQVQSAGYERKQGHVGLGAAAGNRI